MPCTFDLKFFWMLTLALRMLNLMMALVVALMVDSQGLVMVFQPHLSLVAVAQSLQPSHPSLTLQ